MPEEYTKYYGFTRFAIELNEISPGLKEKLPNTDTRCRPDQRLLEEGQLSESETLKLSLEQKQRERRKQLEEQGIPHTPTWFKKSKNNSRQGTEQWEFSGGYWESRKNAFKSATIEELW